MIPRMRTVGLVFLGFVVFLSLLVATGCGDNTEPSVESCDDVALVLCPVLAECGNLLVSEAECVDQMPGFCEPYGPDAFDLSDLSCEAMDNGEYLPEGAGPG